LSAPRRVANALAVVRSPAPPHYCDSANAIRCVRNEHIEGGCNEHSWKNYIDDIRSRRRRARWHAGGPGRAIGTGRRAVIRTGIAGGEAGDAGRCCRRPHQAGGEEQGKLDWRRSIVDLMKLLNLDSSLAARKELAGELHYTGDTNDSATMNIWLHKQVMQKLADNGGKVPDELRK
jgi:hypothetical protein